MSDWKPINYVLAAVTIFLLGLAVGVVIAPRSGSGANGIVKRVCISPDPQGCL